MKYDIKQEARASLGERIFPDQWINAVIICAICMAANGVVTYVTNKMRISFSLNILILGPLSFSQAYIFLKHARDRRPMEFADLAIGFTEDLGGNLVLGLLTTLYEALWTCLFIIPGIMKSYSYAMAYFIKADLPELTARECMKKSTELMDGHRWELFCLDLSFIGWFIVGALCLGIGTLWPTAYLNAAHAQFYENLIQMNYDVSAEM